ncbi:MAG: DMT family transporter [Thermoleophilaceae bacterium]|nr:DMT family transporter [Thermoleophilaceae bacterium]
MVFGSQLAGLAIVSVIILVRGDGPPAGSDWAFYAAASGAAGAVGLAAFYRGLAIGAMGVVAPISAIAAVVPVVVGVASGERPGALQFAGIAIAITGVALTSLEAPEEGASARLAAGVPLALAAALGFGLFFVFMDRASDADVGWALFANRCTGVSLLLLAVLVVRPGRPDRRSVGLVALVGVLDTSANGMFAIASTKGLVSLVAVLGSLYPVVVIALARFVLQERLRRIQLVGAALALTGVALISAG